MIKYYTLLFIGLLQCQIFYAAIWRLGPSQAYTLPSQINTLVQDGDTIYFDGGVYLNASCKWSKKNLKFIGLGIGSNRSILKCSSDIPNGKGIFVFETPGICDNAYFENLVFDGAQVSDANGANGAGIRYQANNLRIQHCKFMNCQNGILEGHANVYSSNVIIENSEFYNNGYQLPNASYSGYEHHIYISASADTLWLVNNWFHHPRGQANSIKTRAQRSFILYNFIDEENSGYGSWEINIAQGGLNIIMGNIIIQGTSGANHGVIGYDAASNPLQDFYFVNNTVINKYPGNSKYFNIVPSTGINTFKIYNNIFASVSNANNTFCTGFIPSSLDSMSNIFSNDYLNIGFSNALTNDFSLSATAVSAIDNSSNAGFSNTSFSLIPNFMYLSFDSALKTRTEINGNIDLGAYEFEPLVNVIPIKMSDELLIFPNPIFDILFYYSKENGNRSNFQILNFNGEKIKNGYLHPGSNEIDVSSLTNGIYFFTVNSLKPIKFIKY